MAISIPSIVGVPGLSGPPNWLGGAGNNFRLDDPRWNGSVQRAFGAGSSQSAALRATHTGLGGGTKAVFLSFRAPFVEGLSDNNDLIYVGLQRTGGPRAMVIRIQVHTPGQGDSGPPPDTQAPVAVAGVTFFTRLNAATSWTAEGGAPPAWIAANTRAWLHNAAPADPNNRWAIQMRVPIPTPDDPAADITAGGGPNLGNDFRMWFLVLGATTTGSPVILGEHRTSGATTYINLLDANFPAPTLWDQWLLSSGPAATGGVALQWGDVRVSNTAYGEGTTIDNGQANTFIVRPRNYTTTPIPASNINATFRIANWGSLPGNPNKRDDASAEWSYVPGNSETVPVLSNGVIDPLTHPNNPPGTNNQLALVVNPMTLGPGKVLHQCIYVTLSGVNLTFLNDSIYQNMNFDSASLLAREATISVRGLAPFSPKPRDVYLAVEKVNMPVNTPAGTNEGQFLQNTMNQLIAGGGQLAQKLRSVQAALEEDGDHGSAARLEALLNGLRDTLAKMDYNNRDQGLAALEQFTKALGAWLMAVKQARTPAAAKSLAALFEALAEWLEAEGAAAATKLVAFITKLSTWLAGLGNDPASTERLPAVLRALRAWLGTLVGGERFTAALDVLARWVDEGRPVTQLPAVINALRELLSGFSGRNNAQKPGLASFSRGVAAWLRGSERLETFVNVLNDAGLTTEEFDQLFPTMRIHAYHDTGERMRGSDGIERPVLRAQSSFGLYMYHEGALDGWQTALEGAERIAENLYLLAVPNNSSSKVTVRVQGVEPGEERIPEDPIRPPGTKPPGGCLEMILGLLGRKGK